MNFYNDLELGEYTVNEDINLVNKQKYDGLVLVKLLDSIPQAVFWKDTNLVFAGCNKAFAKQFDFDDPSEIIGKTDADFNWAKADAEEYRRDDLNILATGKPKLNYEETQRQPDGTIKTVLVSKVPLYEKNQIVGVLGIYSDITEKKNLEAREKIALTKVAEQHARAAAELELRRAVTVLASSIAHDLRVPLTAAILKIDLLNQTQTQLSNLVHNPTIPLGQLKENVDTYLESTKVLLKKTKKVIYDMNEFIDTTLKAMQRLVSGTLSEEDLVECEIEQCLHDVLIRYPFQGNEKSLLQIEQLDNFSFRGIPVLFYRILFNLLGNAFHQIQKYNSGMIFISAGKSDRKNILRIKDTAGHVNPEMIPHLFKDFHTSKTQGTGVGLAFCKLTMESFGGHIEANYIEGDYIEFILTFPTIAVDSSTK
ncbi:MAG: PAS domain-containing protein [Gammaproteobacteria bacterium]